MSTFTIPLKEVITLTGGTTDIINGIRKLTGGNIGLDAYPIFDSNYRDTLNGKIVDHYWNQDIGVETIDMFQLGMRRKMNELMPFYNQLYLSTKIEYDPLSTVDIRTLAASESVNTTKNDGSNANTTNNVSGSRAVNSDTPQTMLSGSEDYATSAADVNSVAEVTSTATEESELTSNSENSGDTHMTGYQGAASDLIMRYRESLINIDTMVISELQEMFMLIWDSGDSYTKGYYL